LSQIKVVKCKRWWGRGGDRAGGGDFFLPFLTSGSSKDVGRNSLGECRKGFAIGASSSAALVNPVTLHKKNEKFRRIYPNLYSTKPFSFLLPSFTNTSHVVRPCAIFYWLVLYS